MEKTDADAESRARFKKLYPNLSDEELERAIHNVRQYLELAVEIWEENEKR